MSNSHRRPASSLWQRLPHGPRIARPRRAQAQPGRRSPGPVVSAAALLASSGLLAVAVRWPGV